MENENQNNKKLYVLVSILAIAVILLGGYFIYDKLVADENNSIELNNNISDNNSKNTNMNANNKDSNSDNVNNNNLNNVNNNNLNNVNNNNLNNDNDNNSSVQNVSTVNSADKNFDQYLVVGKLNVFVNKNGEAYIYADGSKVIKNETMSKEFKYKVEDPYGPEVLKAMKVDVSNVSTAYFSYLGNSGASYFIFIKKDRTLAYFSISDLTDKGKVVTKNIDNISNIVSIIDSAHDPIAITANGEGIYLRDYLK